MQTSQGNSLAKFHRVVVVEETNVLNQRCLSSNTIIVQHGLYTMYVRIYIDLKITYTYEQRWASLHARVTSVTLIRYITS